MKNFNHKWKNDTIANTTTLSAREVLLRSSFLDILNPLDKKLDLGELQLEATIVSLFFSLSPSRPQYQPSPQITLSWAETLDWPVSSLLHSSLNAAFDPHFLVVWFDGIWNQPSGRERFFSIRRSMGGGVGGFEIKSIKFSYIFEVWEGCNYYVHNYIIPPQETEKEVENEECKHVLGNWLQQQRRMKAQC